MTQVGGNPRLDDYLCHMLEAARLARSYVQELTKTEFLQDRRTQQAVVLNLMTIGEAAGRIVSECKEFAAAHPEIPWAQMRGMRNRMVHGYFGYRSEHRVGHGAIIAAGARTSPSGRE